MPSVFSGVGLAMCRPGRKCLAALTCLLDLWQQFNFERWTRRALTEEAQTLPSMVLYLALNKYFRYGVYASHSRWRDMRAGSFIAKYLSMVLGHLTKIDLA